jgi:modulator of FtsH protease
MTRAIAGFQDQCLKPLGHTSGLRRDFTTSAQDRDLLLFRLVGGTALSSPRPNSRKNFRVEIAGYLVETSAPFCGLMQLLQTALIFLAFSLRKTTMQNDVSVSSSYSTQAGTIGAAQNRVLRNTYMLLGLSLVPTVIGAVVGMSMNFTFFSGSPAIGFIAFLAIAFGFFYAIEKTKNSAWGVAVLLGFTFFMGLMLSRMIGRVLGMSNGGQLIALAAGGTAVIFFGMSTLAATIKRDLTNMGKFLFVGMIILLVAGFANIFLQIPALTITLMVVAIGIFSAFLMYDINRVITGGETNYISATLAIYLSIYNIFANLLALLGITNSSD